MLTSSAPPRRIHGWIMRTSANEAVRAATGLIACRPRDPVGATSASAGWPIASLSVTGSASSAVNRRFERCRIVLRDRPESRLAQEEFGIMPHAPDVEVVIQFPQGVAKGLDGVVDRVGVVRIDVISPVSCDELAPGQHSPGQPGFIRRLLVHDLATAQNAKSLGFLGPEHAQAKLAVKGGR